MEAINSTSFDELRQQWLSDDTDFIPAMTSGSTGKPKIINLSRNDLEENALRTIRFFNLDSSSLLHSCVGAQYIGGKMMLIRSLVCGCQFSYEQPSNNILKTFGKSDVISLLAVVPSQMISLLDNIGKIPRIDNIIIGGSAISPQIRDGIIESGLNAFETYGMTETCSHIALRKVSNDGLPFRCLPGIKVSADERGCLVIRFDSGKTIVTNDLAHIFSDTEFNILGRYDDVIISGGCKVNPIEVEHELQSFFNNPIAVTSIPNKKWGEMVVMLSTVLPLDIDGLRTKLQQLPSSHRPKALGVVSHLPYNANGKFIRSEMPDIFIFSPKIINLSTL